MASVISRQFKLEHTPSGTTRDISHYQFIGWPDHGIPTSTQPVLDMLGVVHSIQVGSPRPVLGHCLVLERYPVESDRMDSACADARILLDYAVWPAQFLCFLTSAGAPVQAELSQPAPIVVHCSAGIGRTGTFCAIDVNLQVRVSMGLGLRAHPCPTLPRPSWTHALRRRQAMRAEGVTDVFGTVLKMRDQRGGMVQTLDQYEFCFKVSAA